MKYGQIVPAEFVFRPNRFVAQVLIEGREELVHVKNTGRCKELLIPGVLVLLEKSDNPNRKTLYDLVCVEKKGLGWVNIDSQAPNQVVREWLFLQLYGRAPRELTLFKGLTDFKWEYAFGSSRLDFYLEEGEEKCLMEVKGVTLEREGIGYFPDAPTLRGVKHLEELMYARTLGYRCYLAFVIQMEGIAVVKPNMITHPQFGEALQRAKEAGVHILYLGCRVTGEELEINSMRME